MCTSKPSAPKIEPVTPQTPQVVLSPLASPYEDDEATRTPGLAALRLGRGGLNARLGGPGQRIKLGRWEGNTAGTKRAPSSNSTAGSSGAPSDPYAAGILDRSN